MGSTIEEKIRRARIIEQIVQDDYLDEDTDAEDLALGELMDNENRSDKEIALIVAMKINQP